MGVTRKSAVTAQVRQIWATDLFSQAERMTFWNRFEGPEGSAMPILRRDDLEKQSGDTIKFDIVLALTGSGSTSGDALTEGNEEDIKFRQASMGIAPLKHAVRWNWESELEITHNMRQTALNQLRKWLAGKIDDAIFNEFAGTGNTTLPTTAQWFAGTATTIGTVDDTDAAGRLKLNDISDIKSYAQVNNRIEPLRTEDGNEYFALIVDPYTALALKKDTAYQQAQRDAQIRGATNPLFTGALALWDGVILFSSDRVVAANDGASSKRVARNVFVGAQALMRGYAMYPTWVEQEFSYGEEIGIATRLVKGEKLVAFDLTSAGGAGAAAYTAIGSMILYASAVAPTA